jgi:hypothetical protein
MPHFEKHFTVEEANALLPELRSLIEAIQAARDRIQVEHQNARPVLKARSQNGGGRDASGYVAGLMQLNERVRRLLDLGVELKDLERGLVDFPAWRGEREVFLCWELREDEIRFWHDLETGYRGRQPL